MLGHADRKTNEGPDHRIGMAIGDGARIDHHRARQRVIFERGTQKLCVSCRSIEALIEARGRRRNEFPMRPRERAGLVHAT